MQIGDVWCIKIRRDILFAEVPTKDQGVPASHQASQPLVPEPGREACITSGCKIQWGLRVSETEDFWSPRQFLLKDSSMNLL